MPPDIELSVSDFVALFNQTMDYAYPSVTLVGELANFRVSRNRWVYFDLKDELSSVKFFGTVYQLPGPLEDGMLLKVRGQPRLHNLYGFSINILSLRPAGEGSLKRAADLLKAKLAGEGLFDEARKRFLPHPPTRLGLITSKQSAAYTDFIKILNARWQGVDISLIDVQVQGEVAPNQIVNAIETFNEMTDIPEVLVLIRGGGSPDDLAAFSNEIVVRAVAASRIPTLVAIGHEIDVSLAELAADQRASTPSNAAEMLVPDRQEIAKLLHSAQTSLDQTIGHHLNLVKTDLGGYSQQIEWLLKQLIDRAKADLENDIKILNILNPQAILRRGYAIVRYKDKIIRNSKDLKKDQAVNIQLANGNFAAKIEEIKYVET